jgi:hypothetical protein
MTISKNEGIISLNLSKSEFHLMHLELKNVDGTSPFTQVMEGYLDTYERD